MFIIFVLLFLLILQKEFNMAKNEIQESRMKNYFIEAAKSIIRGEGMRALSVRTVAEEAGYSYATLYNYFDNLKELIYFCLKDFMDECRQFVKDSKHPSEAGKASYMSKSKAFCNYFVQYPGIFEVIFTLSLRDLAYTEKIPLEIDALFINIFDEDYKVLAENLSMDYHNIFLTHKFAVTGLLAFYLLRRQPAAYSEFLKEMESVLN